MQSDRPKWNSLWKDTNKDKNVWHKWSSQLDAQVDLVEI